MTNDPQCKKCLAHCPGGLQWHVCDGLMKLLVENSKKKVKSKVKK